MQSENQQKNLHKLHANKKLKKKSQVVCKVKISKKTAQVTCKQTIQRKFTSCVQSENKQNHLHKLHGNKKVKRNSEVVCKVKISKTFCSTYIQTKIPKKFTRCVQSEREKICANYLQPTRCKINFQGVSKVKFNNKICTRYMQTNNSKEIHKLCAK